MKICNERFRPEWLLNGKGFRRMWLIWRIAATMIYVFHERFS